LRSVLAPLFGAGEGDDANTPDGSSMMLGEKGTGPENPRDDRPGTHQSARVDSSLTAENPRSQ
jgi:hypothetical protein